MKPLPVALLTLLSGCTHVLPARIIITRPEHRKEILKIIREEGIEINQFDSPEELRQLIKEWPPL